MINALKGTIFKVYFFREVHLGCYCLEDKTLLPPVWQRELNFSVKSAWPEEGRVERVRSVGCHDDFHVDCLVEAIHLIEQLDEDSLNLTISSSMCIKTPMWNKDNDYLVAMASISSMKTMEGAFSLASLKTSLTILGPSPRYFCTNSEPTTLMMEALV